MVEVDLFLVGHQGHLEEIPLPCIPAADTNISVGVIKNSMKNTQLELLGWAVTCTSASADQSKMGQVSAPFEGQGLAPLGLLSNICPYVQSPALQTVR